MIFKYCFVFGIGFFSAITFAQSIGQAAGDPAGFLKGNIDSNPKCTKCDLEPEERIKRDGGSAQPKSDQSKGSGGTTNPPLKK